MSRGSGKLLHFSPFSMGLITHACNRLNYCWLLIFLFSSYLFEICDGLHFSDGLWHYVSYECFLFLSSLLSYPSLLFCTLLDLVCIMLHKFDISRPFFCPGCAILICTLLTYLLTISQIYFALQILFFLICAHMLIPCVNLSRIFRSLACFSILWSFISMLNIPWIS